MAVTIDSTGVMVVEVGFAGPPGTGIPATGEPGQLVGYDAEGNPTALDPSAASIPAGTPGQVLGYGAGGVPQAVNPPVPANIDLGTFN